MPAARMPDRRAPRAVAVLLAVLLAAAAPAAAQEGVPPSGVRVGATVQPASVGIGEPVTLTVRVQVAVGVTVRFPAVVDSTDRIEPLDPVVLRETSTEGRRDVTATYRFVAWRTGALPIPLGPIEIERDGRVQRLRVGAPPVEVRSVLPADTAQRSPRPARDIIRRPADWWWVLWLAAVVAAIGTLLWWAWRTRGRAAPRPPSAAAVATDALDALERLALVAAGESGRHAIAAAAILRGFLAQRDPAAAIGLTAQELGRVVARDAAVPDFRVVALLEAVDAIQFAGAAVSAATAQALGLEARAIIVEIERASSAREVGR